MSTGSAHRQHELHPLPGQAVPPEQSDEVRHTRAMPPVERPYGREVGQPGPHPPHHEPSTGFEFYEREELRHPYPPPLRQPPEPYGRASHSEHSYYERGTERYREERRNSDAGWYDNARGAYYSYEGGDAYGLHGAGNYGHDAHSLRGRGVNWRDSLDDVCGSRYPAPRPPSPGRQIQLDMLRDELRAARRQLEAAARREASLRQVLRQAETEAVHMLVERSPRAWGPQPLPGLGGRMQQRSTSEPLRRAERHAANSALPLDATDPGLSHTQRHEGDGEPSARSAVSGPRAAAVTVVEEHLPVKTAPPAVNLAVTEVSHALWAHLCNEVVAQLVPGVVKEAVRGVVASRVPLRRKPVAEVGRAAIADELCGVLLADVLIEEARGAVVFALRAVAKEYTANRRAQRAYDAILTEVLREDLEGVRYDPNVPIEDREEKAVAPEYISMDPSRSLLPDILKKGERAGLVYQWRSDALSDAALDVLLEPHLEMVARAALREARGKQARRRDAAERDLVSKHALEAVLEPMLLERMVQQIAARAEPLLFQRHAAQWLDEICSDALFAYASDLSRRHKYLEESPILAGAQRRLALAAMLEEMICQMLSLVTTGSEANMFLPVETDEEDAADS